MTQTRDLIKKMADFFTGEEFYEKGEDARLELSPDDVRCMNDLIKQIGSKRLKEQEPKWIPVSEGLPEKNEWYSCTVDLSNLDYVTMDLYFKDGKWLDNRRINMFYCYEIYGFGESTEKHKLDYSELLEYFDWTERVVAWMPLPKSFDPQESEDKE